jgi:hypothetical protein
LKNADRIAQIFINFFRYAIDGGEPSEGRLHNILRSLKSKLRLNCKTI